MRPQRNAAENFGIPGRSRKNESASMRPQRNAAENDNTAFVSVIDYAGYIRNSQHMIITSDLAI